MIDLRQQASQAYQAATTAYENNDYAAAKAEYDLALQGGLNSDLLGTVRVHRAVCLAELGDFDAAAQELDLLEKGAPNLDEVFAARSYLLQKQGKTAESRAAWAKARRYNQGIKKFGK